MNSTSGADVGRLQGRFNIAGTAGRYADAIGRAESWHAAVSRVCP